MNLSITIPQIFYDLIARVLPGFLLLSMLRLVISGTSAYTDFFPQIDSAAGAVDQALSGIGTLVMSYFAGWVLRGLTIWGASEPAQFADELHRKYQEIRLRNPEAGFRIVKLRAEARMLEASRTAMFLVFGIVLVVLVLRLLGPVTATRDDVLAWVIRLALPAVLCATFWALEGPHWRIYYGNISSIHEVLADKGSATKSGDA